MLTVSEPTYVVELRIAKKAWNKKKNKADSNSNYNSQPLPHLFPGVS